MKSTYHCIGGCIVEAGAALYGPRWQSELARALNVSDRTMRRWLAADDVPPVVNYDLMPLLEAKAAEINKIATKIRWINRRGEGVGPGRAQLRGRLAQPGGSRQERLGPRGA